MSEPGRSSKITLIAFWATLVLVWPFILCYLAIRGVVRFGQDFRVARWQAVTTSRVIWLIFITSLFVTGALPLKPGLPADITTVVWLACAGTLAYRWWQRKNQRAWRESRGRMGDGNLTDRRTRPSAQASLDAKLAAALAEIEANKAAIAALRAGLVIAFEAGGEPVPDSLQAVEDDDTRPMLRLIRGEGGIARGGAGIAG
jgi:hypothetical protein